MDKHSSQALRMIAALQAQADQAATQLTQLDAWMPIYDKGPFAAHRALRLYRSYLTYLEDVIKDPDNAVPPDIFY